MSLIGDALSFAKLFPEAVICGTVMAAVCSAFGVFVVLKRVVFISIALSEAATCGLALALVYHFSPLAGSALVTGAVVFMLTLPEKRQHLPKDVVLGTVFLLASSASVLLVAQSGFGLEEIKAMLYGDLIVSSPRDRWVLLLTGLPSLASCCCFCGRCFTRSWTARRPASWASAAGSGKGFSSSCWGLSCQALRKAAARCWSSASWWWSPRRHCFWRGDCGP
ncbi:MAG TPA: metal ABC transporter permease [Kiritimatiellia bacterium]|nr:metal ABC transporter permease [Kiritimatiellia bacterium]